MRRILVLAVIAAAAALLASVASAGTAARFSTAVQQILSEPYQPTYVPAGFDSAFSDADVLNTAPAQDYTSGSIPGSPDAPAWPPWFRSVQFASADGAPLLGELALHPGDAPAVVVVHGFNTHGYASVIRWAAMLYANGYDVLAADQRDFSFENDAGFGYPAGSRRSGGRRPRTCSRRAATWRRSRHVDVGLVGFSQGGQNTVLALALDARPRVQGGHPVQRAADQDTQIYTRAVPAGCGRRSARIRRRTHSCSSSCRRTTTPTSASRSIAPAASYGTDGFSILSHETAFHSQQSVKVPLLNVYSADDSLVPAFEAQMMAGYEVGNPLQRTLEVTRGEHASSSTAGGSSARSSST